MITDSRRYTTREYSTM